MTRSLNVLSKILGLTASSNPHEAKAAEAKLEQQLLARGITKEQLEAQLDMQTVEEDLEATNFTYGKPYKRVDPAVSIILGAVARFYNGKVVHAYNNEESVFDDGYRILEVFATKGRKIEIEIYTDYLLQALDDAWTKHTAEDPFMVAMNGKSYRNNFRKNWAWKVADRFRKMTENEEERGRQLLINSKKVNQSAMVVRGKNEKEKEIVNVLVTKKYPKLYSGSGYTSGGSGSSAGRSAGSSVGLSRQVSGGGQKQLSGY